jgi:hypothetical protein
MPPPPEGSAISMRRDREWAMGTGSARPDTRSAESATRLRSVAGIASLALLALLLAAGCWTRKADEIMRPDPTPPSGFLEEPDQLEDTGGRAFQRAWVEPGFWFDRYGSILVAPVDVSHLLAMSGWEKAGLHTGGVEQEARELAEEMREKFAQALREQPDARLHVVQQPTEGTAILELAIVQIVPSKEWLALVGLGAWVAGPPGVPMGTAAGVGNRPSLALEGRLRDASTGRVWARFADNQAARTRPLNVEAVTWYGHAHQIIDAWAVQFAAIANGSPEVEVFDDSFFTLAPW